MQPVSVTIAEEKDGDIPAQEIMTSISPVNGMDSGVMMSILKPVSVSVISSMVCLKTLSFLIFCLKELPCPEQPPKILDGEGAERNYGMEITTYRCPNGYEWWHTVKGKQQRIWPYLEVECLNKKWSIGTLPECISKYFLKCL